MASSLYMSEFFIDSIWPLCSSLLKRVKTQRAYFSYACSICDFCKCDFCDISSADAQKYFDYRRDNDQVSNSTLHTILTAFVSIARCIEQHKDSLGIDYHSPFDCVMISPRAMGFLSSDIVSASDLDRILSTAADEPYVFLAVSLAFRCALTPSEICSLDSDSITPYSDGTGIAIVKRNASSTSRAVKVPSDIMELISSAGIDFSDSSPIFVNAHGDRMSLRVLQNRVHSVMAKAGTARIYTLQDIRNSSIAYMLHAGADRKSVASYVNLDSKWMYRFTDDIVPMEAPCDYNYINIQRRS